jgi:hypothetical protein
MLELEGIRGKRGRGAAGEMPVFGLLKRGGKVYVKAVTNCSKKNECLLYKGKYLNIQPYIQMVGRLMMDSYSMVLTITAFCPLFILSELLILYYQSFMEFLYFLYRIFLFSRTKCFSFFIANKQTVK